MRLFTIFILFISSSWCVELSIKEMEIDPINRFTVLKAFFNPHNTLPNWIMKEFNQNTYSSSVPIQNGLSPNASKKLNRYSSAISANCFNAVFMALSKDWKERFMSTKEFECLITTYTEEAYHWEFGDIIVLSSDNEVIHGMVYLGWEKNKPDRHVVFTKNGMDPSTRYRLTYLSHAMSDYPFSTKKFYRLKRWPEDPSLNPYAPCSALSH